jgi:hypothetical protein
MGVDNRAVETLATTESATIVFSRLDGGKIRAISLSFKDDGVQAAKPGQVFEVRLKDGRLVVTRKGLDPEDSAADRAEQADRERDPFAYL